MRNLQQQIRNELSVKTKKSLKYSEKLKVGVLACLAVNFNLLW